MYYFLDLGSVFAAKLHIEKERPAELPACWKEITEEEAKQLKKHDCANYD